MIEGIKFDVKSEELVEIYDRAIKREERKLVLYREAQGKLAEADQTEEDDDLGLRVSNYSGDRSLKDKILATESSIRNLKFSRDHVPANEVLRIGHDELYKLHI